MCHSHCSQPEAVMESKPDFTGTDETRESKEEALTKRPRRLRVHNTRVIEETLIPDEVKAPLPTTRVCPCLRSASTSAWESPPHIWICTSTATPPLCEWASAGARNRKSHSRCPRHHPTQQQYSQLSSPCCSTTRVRSS